MSAALPPPLSQPQAAAGEASRGSAIRRPGAVAAGRPPPRLILLAVVMVLHGLVLAVLFSPAAPPSPAPPESAPILVSLLAAEQPAPVNRPAAPTAAPQPPKPQHAAAVPSQPQLQSPSRPQIQPRPTPRAPQAPAAEQPATTAPSAISEPAPAGPSAPPVTSAGEAAPSASLPTSLPRYDAAYLNNQTRPYPPLARRLGESGTVRLRVLVSAEGLAEKIELLASSGSPRLDEDAREAVRHLRFIPARQGDQPVPSHVVVPIIYKLEES